MLFNACSFFVASWEIFMKQHYHILFLTLLVVTFLSSCVFNKLLENGTIEEIEVSVEQPNPPQPHLKISGTKQKHFTVPVDTGPKDPETILSDYRLGKGDVISIKVFGEPDFSMETALNQEGKISYPFLGELKLSGLSVSQIEKKITLGLKDGYLKDPKVTVTVLEYRQLFVTGEVNRPGGYAFQPGMTVNKAITLGGGFTETASPDEIFIIRDGEKNATEKKVGLDSFVAPGDIIIVKKYKEFFMSGEVRNPGNYRYIPNLTVEKAISMAGGLSEFASPNWSKIYVIRDKDKTGKKIRVNLKSPVYPGDIITVGESLF